MMSVVSLNNIYVLSMMKCPWTCTMLHYIYLSIQW